MSFMLSVTNKPAMMSVFIQSVMLRGITLSGVMVSIVILRVIILRVVILSVVMLNVVAPHHCANFKTGECFACIFFQKTSHLIG